MRENNYTAIPENIGKFAFNNFASYQEYQSAAKAELRRLLGLDNILAEPRIPLNPKLVWRRQWPQGTVERISLDMEDGESTFIYLGIPNTRQYRTAFVCLHGHDTGIHRTLGVDWRDETSPATFGNNDHMEGFLLDVMARGMVGIALEQRYFGERSTSPDHEPSCGCYAGHSAGDQALLVGRTAIGERVFELSRLLEYLRTRPEIDTDEIGLTGLSGGGTATLFGGAMLPEFKYVMPCGCFSTFRASIGSMFHCACNYIPHLLELGESADVAGLIAPRRLIIVNGDADPIFPVAPGQRQFERLQRIYTAAGAENNCAMLVGHGEHRYFPDLAWSEMCRCIKPW